MQTSDDLQQESVALCFLLTESRAPDRTDRLTASSLVKALAEQVSAPAS